MKVILALHIALISAVAVIAQTPSPGKVQEESILYTNATIHVGDGTVVLDGAIGFDNGLINFVGITLDARENLYDKVINASQKHIYPGFIAPNSTLGLQEIGSVRATRDQREVGEFNPHVRSVIAFQTESEITPTVRTNGVLLGQITPRGRFIAGQSSVVHFDGWNWEDALIKESDGIHIYWPRLFERDHTGKLISYAKRESYTEWMRELEAYFKRAKAYSLKTDSTTIDLRLEALSALLENRMTLYVHANDAKQITAAIDLKRRWNLENMVIIGAQESYLVLNLLKENNIGVMVGRVHDLPRNEYDDIYLPYKLPSMLENAGILWCFENAGDMEQMNSRNLPFYAGTAIAFGLKYEDAVKGLTLNSAKLLGIEDKWGSIEVGKEATLFISEGDALDMMSNNVTEAFLSGRRIELNNRQIELYEKYKSKYEK